MKANDWIGQELELSLGTYKDWKTDPPVDKETVKVQGDLAGENSRRKWWRGGLGQAGAAAEQGSRGEDG